MEWAYEYTLNEYGYNRFKSYFCRSGISQKTTFNLKKAATQGGGGKMVAARDSKAFAKDDS